MGEREIIIKRERERGIERKEEKIYLKTKYFKVLKC